MNLDFNDVSPSRDASLAFMLTNGRIDLNETHYETHVSRYDTTRLKQIMADRAMEWVPRLFSSGRRNGDEWRMGDITGRPPRKSGSCVIQLRGERAGCWVDFQDPDTLHGDQLDTYARGRGLSMGDAIREAALEFGMAPMGIPSAPKAGVPPWEADKEAAKEKAKREQEARDIEAIIKRGISIVDTLAQTYLSSRQLPTPAKSDLLFVADLTHTGSMAGWPAMVGICRKADGSPLGGIHRTWIARDGNGKAPVEKAKMMLGPCVGGAVRLAPMGEDGVLGYSEGIETGIAAMKLYNVPVWATLSTSGMRSAPIPAGIKRAMIFADHGDAGMTAANVLKASLLQAGVPAEIILPQSDDDFAKDIELGISYDSQGLPESHEVAVTCCDVMEAARALTQTSSPAQIEAVLRQLSESGLSPIGEQPVLDLMKSRTKISTGKLSDVLRSIRREATGASPSGLLLPSAPWQKRVILSMTGDPKPLLANAILVFKNAQDWRGALAFNELSGVPELRRSAPWQCTKHIVQEEWTETHDLLATEWMQQIGLHLMPEIIRQAVEVVSREHSYHPVRDYLDALVWDGVPRLDGWLPFYLGADDSPYIRACGSRWMIGAVARIYQPGAKMDTALILEGDQGLKKSTALKILGEPWFTDEMADLGSKDAAMQTRGAWIIELAELDSMSKGEVGKIKAFMTRTVDRFRPPYGRRLIESARQCVFAGSVNPDGSGYLKDATGGRRFWPVRCTKILTDDLRTDRSQLWAEARVRYQNGDVWWLDTADLLQAASAEQAARLQGDPWEEAILIYLTKERNDMDGKLYERAAPLNDVSIGEILGAGLGIERGRWSRSDQMRLAQYLISHGWQRYYARTCGERVWRYRKIF